MSKLVEIYLDQAVVLPVKNAAKIIELLEGGSYVSQSWNDESVSITKDIKYTVTAFSETKFKAISKAQILGMTYKEFLDAERIAKDSVQKDQNVLTDTD
jgi:hypothetical protein